jgi:hypothetical protein
VYVRPSTTAVVNNFSITNVIHDNHITVIVIDGMITTNVSNSRNITQLIITTIVTNAWETLSSIIFLPTLIELIMKSAKWFFLLCMFVAILLLATPLFPGFSLSGYDYHVIGWQTIYRTRLQLYGNAQQ